MFKRSPITAALAVALAASLAACGGSKEAETTPAVAAVAPAKLRKEDGAPQLDLVENPDILAGLVAGRRPGQVIVGFAAETADSDAELLERGRRKAARKGADLLVVNRVDGDRGFERPDNDVLIMDAAGEILAEASGPKRLVADAVWDAVSALRARRA